MTQKNGPKINCDEDSYVALQSDVVTGQSSTWIIDSGASNYMTWYVRMFKNYVTLATSLTILGKGDVVLNIWNGSTWQPTVLKKYLHVKGLSFASRNRARTGGSFRHLTCKMPQLYQRGHRYRESM
jgi:hypothetical protein